MARKRMISPEFWTDDKVIELTIHERLLFIGLWNFSDDEGLIANKPKQMKAQIFPVDDVTHGVISEMLMRIHGIGLIDYGNGGTLIRIKGWKRWQKINRPTPSNFPAFRKGIIEPSVNTHGGLTPSIKEDKGKEDKRIEKNISPQPKKVSSNNLLSYPDRVNKFYNELEQDNEYLIQLKEAYPNIDIVQQLRSSKIWLISNPQKAKKNFKRFVNTWMANQMEYSVNKPNVIQPDVEDKRVERDRLEFQRKLKEADKNVASDEEREEALGGWVSKPNKYKEAHDEDVKDNAQPLKNNLSKLLSGVKHD